MAQARVELSLQERCERIARTLRDRGEQCQVEGGYLSQRDGNNLRQTYLGPFAVQTLELNLGLEQ